MKIKQYENGRKVLFIYILSVMFYLFVIILTKRQPSEILNVFDSFRYRHIAENGYMYEMHTAFFPVIPIILKIIGPYGMVFINQICHIGTLILFEKLLMCEESKKWLIIMLYAMSPLTAFSLIPYTESLYMFLTLYTFYLFSKRKINVTFGIILGLCVATRNSGSILFFSIFTACCYLLYKKQIKFANIVKAYIPATIISCIYPVFLQIKFGNWKIFMDCQFEYWDRKSVNIIELLQYQIRIIFDPNYYYKGQEKWIQILYVANEIMTITIGVFIIITGLYAIYKVKKQQKLQIPETIISTLYTGVCMFCFASSIRDPELTLHAPTVSFYRYYIGLFPIWFSIQHLPEKILKILMVIVIPISFIICYLFFREIFFY